MKEIFYSFMLYLTWWSAQPVAMNIPPGLNEAHNIWAWPGRIFSLNLCGRGLAEKNLKKNNKSNKFNSMPYNKLNLQEFWCLARFSNVFPKRDGAVRASWSQISDRTSIGWAKVNRSDCTSMTSQYCNLKNSKRLLAVLKIYNKFLHLQAP